MCAFIQQEHIKLVNTFVLLQAICIAIYIFFTFYSSKNPEKKSVSTKILGSTTVFNIDDNKKCFLSTKSAY